MERNEQIKNFEKKLKVEIAKSIAAIRKEQGLSQVKMATGLGISQAKLSKIESCKANLSASEFYLLCDKYKLDTYKLIEKARSQ